VNDTLLRHSSALAECDVSVYTKDLRWHLRR
jgi:hypothetical protein